MHIRSTYKNTNFRPRKRPESTATLCPLSTGKEKDSETGYYYFGARYYNSDLTLWLSVDPMSDKYPSLSPYNYCAWNPMKIIDPDGQFPRMPYFMRVMTSRHVYSAVAYKIRHGGDLNVWESRSGCILASVQSRNGGVDASGNPVIEAKMFRPKGYTSEAQLKATTDVFANAEAWMDEPATNVEDAVIKAAANIGYSLFNEPIELLTGYSLAGSEANSNDLEEAFAGVASSKLGVLLKKGMGTIKTIGKTGLDKYNDYVHKMGNYKGKTKNRWDNYTKKQGIKQSHSYI